MAGMVDNIWNFTWMIAIPYFIVFVGISPILDNVVDILPPKA